MTKFTTKNCTLRLKNSALMSFLSMSTIFLLILASIVLISAIEITPIILLGLGQIPEGQRDLILSPKGEYLNSTAVEILSGYPVMPRLQATFITKEQRKAGTVWFMDFTKEKEHHLGTIGGSQPKDHNFVYVSQDYNFSLNSQVQFHIYQNDLWSFLQKKILATKDQKAIQQYKFFKKSQQKFGIFVVKEVFQVSMGKFGQGKTNSYIYLDIKYAIQQIINYTLLMSNMSSKQLLSYLPQSTFAEFSSQATINLPDRLSVYMQPSPQKIYRDLVQFSLQINQKIGIFAIKSQSPISQNLTNLNYLGMFIGMMLKIVIVCLFVLSVMMMNNMLQISSDTKHFQFAVVKLLGAGRLSISFNLIYTCFKYILVSNILAYPLALLVLSFISDTFQSLFGYRYNVSPTFSSIIGAILIGVCVPLTASVLPLLNIFNKDLAENLNPSRNQVTATYTQIYVEGRQFPWGTIIFGFLTASYGIMIYYLLPKALINQMLEMLLIIFFVILIGFLIGLILIGFSVQYVFEKFIAYFTLFWANKTDFSLTLKNLSAHRIKNRKTSLLYAISVAFIVFVSVDLDIQLQTIKTIIFSQHGTYVQIKGNNLNMTFYNNLLNSTQGVVAWSFQTHNMFNDLTRIGIKDMFISDKARLFLTGIQVIGVSANFPQTFVQPITNPVWTDAQPPYNPFNYLSSPKGYMTCIISASLAPKLYVSQQRNRQVLLNYYFPDKIIRNPLTVSSIYDKFAGLPFGRLDNYFMAVSLQTYRFLGGYPSHENLPISKIKIQVNNYLNVYSVSRSLRAQGAQVWDFLQINATFQQIQSIIKTIESILLILVLIISFFSLLTTSFINIIKQKKEIGILLTLGYSKVRIAKIYIYEAFVLVLNSCLLGALVGYVVAVLMTLQGQLFFQINIKIDLNWLYTLFFTSIISSLLSSIQPLRKIFQLPITQILKQG